MANQEMERQRQAQQQQWQDQMQLAAGRSGMAANQASMLGQQAQNANQAWNTGLQGVGAIGAAYAKANPSTQTPDSSLGMSTPTSSDTFTMPAMGT